MMNTAGKCKPFFYGWVIVALPFTDLALVSGVCYSFSAFVLPFTREFGWTRAEISGAFALNTALYGFIGPAAGFLLDRFGPRRAMAAGFSLGPWLAGWLYDLTGGYHLAFGLVIVSSMISVAATWAASPRKVRAVSGETGS